MSKLVIAQRLPVKYDRGLIQELVRLTEEQINSLAEGRIIARHAAVSAIPTSGNYSKGDIVWDSAPAITNGRIRLGWVSTTSGAPGTLSEINVLGQGSALVLGTEQAATSGTSIDFGSIPSWVRRITIQFAGVSTNGTSNIIVQVGDADGIENTGYLGSATTISGTSVVATSNFTAGFSVQASVGAGSVMHGQIMLTLEDATNFTWVSGATIGHSDGGAVSIGASSKSLSAALDRVRITTAGGTDTFDAGAINIILE